MQTETRRTTTWAVTVTREEGDDWPNLSKQYTDKTFRPTRLRIQFDQTDDDAVEMSAVTASGPRLLSGGRLGAVVDDRWYGMPANQSWLAAIVREVSPAPSPDREDSR
jgi:hypothetical protein